jgi:hypothetical protein
LPIAVPQRNSLALVSREQAQQFHIHEQLVAAVISPLKDTQVSDPLEIDRGSLSLRDSCVDEIADSAIRSPKQDLDQFA